MVQRNIWGQGRKILYDFFFHIVEIIMDFLRFWGLFDPTVCGDISNICTRKVKYAWNVHNLHHDRIIVSNRWKIKNNVTLKNSFSMSRTNNEFPHELSNFIWHFLTPRSVLNLRIHSFVIMLRLFFKRRRKYIYVGLSNLKWYNSWGKAA